MAGPGSEVLATELLTKEEGDADPVSQGCLVLVHDEVSDIPGPGCRDEGYLRA